MKIKHILVSCLLIVLTFLSVNLSAENDYYELVYDKYFSMYTGTKTLRNIYSLTCSLTESLIMDILLQEKSLSDKPLGFAIRTGKFILLDFPVAYITFIFQHEYFGHGNLPREISLDVSYKFYNPLPYGWGGAEITINDISGYRNLSYYQQAYTTTSGVESSQFLSKEIQKDFYIKEKTNYTDLLLYGISKLDISAYIFVTDPDDWTGDINSFMYEFPMAINERLDKNELYKNLQLGAIWNILDPTLWLSGYYGMRYFLYGERNVKIPMFRFRETYFMPATRFSLTPIGYEYYFEIMLLNNKTLWNTYFRKGRGGDDFYYGSGIGIYNIILCKEIILGVNIDLWQQPKQEKYYAEQYISSLNFNLDGKFYFYDNIGLTGNVGYKGEGYLMGSPYEKGVYGYAGIIFGF